MNKKNPLYYAKILLFGEYSIIEDAMGLSIPFHDFNGEFKSEPKTEIAINSNSNLKKYATFLHTLNVNHTLNVDLNTQAFLTDVDNGLFFDSSIPQGFGIGSSGALVAAVYSKYAKSPINPIQIEGDNFVKLKQNLAQLENYFHGKSSGLDPLICYLNLPVLIKDKQHLSTVDIASNFKQVGKSAIFLINSGTPGHTQSMVSIFMQKLKNRGFRNLFKNELKNLNNDCIHDFLSGNIPSFFANLKGLSHFFLNYFKPMIPTNLEGIWKQGIETNTYYLKLCGSGGGGYVLGFTQDIEKTQTMLQNYKLNIIHRF